MKGLILALSLLISTSVYSFSQNGWTQVATYPGSGSTAIAGFNFLNTGLAGLGYYTNNTNNFADLWEYYPFTDTWVARANFPGPTRYCQSGFSLGKLAYICLGSNATNYFDDLWEYDRSSNTWSQKTSFPGTERYGAIAVGAGTKAYVGLGQYYYNGTIQDYFTDFYTYDQPTNTWTQKATFPGQARYNPFAVLLDGDIYVVGGRSIDPPFTSWTYLYDVYAYDIATDTWSQKTSYPGAGSVMLGGFVLGQYAYVGTGYDGTSDHKDFWKYDPQTDTWVQLPDFPGLARRSSMYFNVGYSGFLGCGRGNPIDMQDFWKYEDPSVGTEEEADNDFRLYPEPADDMLHVEGSGIRYIELYTGNGQLVKHIDINMPDTKTTFDISDLAAGFYYARISTGNNVIARKVIKR